MICNNCRRRLKADAINCLCGWSASGARPARMMVPCCFHGCGEGALVRLWARTGWANVCVAHYGKVDTIPRRTENFTMKEIRDAYENSYQFRRLRDGVAVPGTVGAALPREPGSDDEPINAAGKDKGISGSDTGPHSEPSPAAPALGIPLDDLERELMDRASP